MQTKPILAFLIFLFVIGLTFFVRLNFSVNPSDNSPIVPQIENNMTANVSIQPPSTPSGVSAAILAEHNLRNDCWVAFRGKVYDVTSFLPNHPGSAGAIIPYCGTSSEFESAFVAQHGNSQVSRLMHVGVLIGDFDVVGRSA